MTSQFLYRRRVFIAGLGAAAAWPLVARAQQPDRVRRIGVLMNLSADNPEGKARYAAFLQALQSLGWVEGRNVLIEARWTMSDADNVRKHATELVGLAPDVIVAPGSATLAPLLQATRTVPVVFVHVPDPVGAGFVDSLARPGGNATGFILSEYATSGKWLELLIEIAPRVTRVGVIRDAAITAGIGQWGAIQTAAQVVKLEATLSVLCSPRVCRFDASIRTSCGSSLAPAASWPRTIASMRG